MTTLTLTNDFHNTAANLQPTGDRLSPSQVARARRELCGVASCRCGGNAGERGSQVDADGHRIAIIPEPDGGAIIERS